MNQPPLQHLISQHLASAISDALLSNDERDSLKELLASANQEQRNFARNTAFDLAKKHANEQPQNAYKIIRWFEKLTKTLDASQQTFSASAFFSPSEECSKTIIQACRRAQLSINVCVFTISDNNIRDALLGAHRRGVELKIITDNDKREDLGSDVDTLIKAGIAIRTDSTRHHMHHKYAIFDGRILINGSFNWTRSATHYNEENITVIENTDLVAQFQNNFDALWDRFK